MRVQTQVEPQAYSIAAFCEAHGISRGLYYILESKGAAPKTMRVGRRRLISKEEAARWREALTSRSVTARAAA